MRSTKTAEAGAPAVKPAGAPASRKRGKHTWPGLVFVGPYLPFLLAFGVLPMLYALGLAFTDDAGGWAGFRNFARTFGDYRFLPAFGHVLLYTSVWLGSLVVLVVGLTLLLHGRANRVSSAFRFLFYIPGALAGASSVLVWLFMLDPAVSPGSFLVRDVFGANLFVESIAPGKLPFIFAMIAFWTGAGGWVVIMYGALNTIPQELEDAARIDGAGPVTIALRIKLPLIRKWIAYMVILSFATGTQLFVEPQLVNQASLGLVPDTWSSNQLAFQLAFRYADFNAAAAISVDLLAIGLLAAALIVTRTGLFRTDD
ncbi:carbohydrate ABC transporter permease [Amycolatopsis balhimycina]|uniref:carbohydrate ABC transporter permease n=1 Tax=Amycolatopsis balhimycina TaxID=208443 RepID=UPI0006883584|nr:sugar ABC transporter permease [Amycolatopsis balhimycina]